jgi:hypothetical protein
MGHRTGKRDRLSLATCAVAGLAALALPAEKASAETWEYCVRNLGTSLLSFGLNKLPGKYGFLTAPADGDRCGSTLEVDHSADTATLTGRMRNGSGKEITINLAFTGMHYCLKQDLGSWLGEWGSLIEETPVPPGQKPLPWQCFDGVSGVIGGPGQAMFQAIDNTPAVGSLRFKDSPKLDLGGFVLGVNSWHWLLGFKLYDAELLDPPDEFEIVGCPSDGSSDAGDPGIPGTSGRQDCSVRWFGDDTLVTTFTNEPDLRGKAQVEARYAIPDPRPHCGGGGFPPANEINYGDYKLTRIAANATRPLDGVRITLTPDTGSIDVPWFMCGIAPPDGEPFIRLVNVDADFQSSEENPDYREIINSVVAHEADGGDAGDADGPVNEDYVCDPATDNADAIVAWLPRTEEIPIYLVSPAGITQKTRQVRDVTSGCGSTRGGSSTRSYLLSNLRHVGTLTVDQLRGILAEEISTLDVTLRQAKLCLEADADLVTGLYTNWSTDSGAPAYADTRSFLRRVRDDFKAGDYAMVIEELQWLLGELDSEGRLYSGFDTCYFKNGKVVNLTEFPALEGSYPTWPDNPGYRPRNFRGDLEAQAEHILWNIEQKLVPAASP